MTPPRGLACLLVLGVAVAGCGGGGDRFPSAEGGTRAAPMSDRELRGVLRRGLERRAADDRFAGAVLLARRGRVIFRGAYGLADRERAVANTLATRFRIGSMNKMFTAVAVLQLVQARKLDLRDRLGEHLTDYPNRELASKVTIHQLLTHTGGTGDIFGPQFEARRLKLRTLDDYVRLYGRRAPALEPGLGWDYSNYGFILLGAVVEAVSGESYYDYVRRHVYARAGMSSTGSEPEHSTVARRSIGYTKRPGAGRLRPNTDTLPYRGTSAGGGYSTVGDLLRFASALQADRLLSRRHTDLLTTGKVDTTEGGRYAYGFHERVDGGVRSFGHGGGAPGMNGALTIYPDSRYVVATLSNQDPPAAAELADFIGDQLPDR